MKPEDFKPGDIVRNKQDGSLWNVDQVMPTGLLLIQRKAAYDLTEWERVDSYHITGKS